MNRSFAHYITKYFGEYLTKQRGASENTLRSYRDTFVQMVEYFGHKHKIHINKLSMDDFTCSRVLSFLDCLENERNISLSTRNQRLAAIHSFFKFIQRNEPSCFSQCADILAIEFKKKPESIIGYLSIEETQFLFSMSNARCHRELRDLTILTTLYETGARVQELINLHLGDISLTSCPTVILSGKGNKSRTVPISNDVASILRSYIKNYAITKTDQHLFTNSQKNKLTRVGVQYVIDKYVERGRTLNPVMLRKNISNHSFRHCKSMHLLEAGVNLLYIRDFLGHTSVTTTEVYAKTNSEIKRKTIEQHGAKIDIQNKYSEIKKNDLLNWLKSTF